MTSAAHLESGEWAEKLAAKYLADKGLKLLQRNFRCRFGEIDIIMRDGKTLVFVEVRMRRSTSFGGPLATVDPHKQRKIRKSAENYLIMNHRSVDVDCRLDVISITGGPENHQLEWIKDAF